MNSKNRIRAFASGSVAAAAVVVAILGWQSTRTRNDGGNSASLQAERVASRKTSDTDTVAPGTRLIDLAVYPATFQIDSTVSNNGSQTYSVKQCQACAPIGCPPPGTWDYWKQGNYVGPARERHVQEYHLRVDDQLQFFYRLTRDINPTPYKLNPGDQVIMESVTDPKLDRGDLSSGRGLEIQPDGNITVPLLGQVMAANLTVAELQETLEDRYRKYYKIPAINVIPIQVDTKLEELRAVFDRRQGFGGQSTSSRVTPAGTVWLPAINKVHVHGLTIAEVKREINAQYAQVVDGIEVTPDLVQRARTFVYVLGEVPAPGRFPLDGPTSVMQAIALAGGWNPGGHLDNVIVFRRTADWGLVATRIKVHRALYGTNATPADDIYLRDSDIVVVPKRWVTQTGDWINLIFTRGIYGVVPIQSSIQFSRLSTI